MSPEPAQQWQGPAVPLEAGHTHEVSKDAEPGPEPPSATPPDVPPTPVLPAPPVPATPPSAWAVRVIAIVALFYFLHWAADFLIPVVFGILISYTLSPIVVWMERVHVPRAAGAGIVTLALLGSAGLVANTMYHEARSVIDELPLATWKVRAALERLDDGEASMYEKLHAAAESLKKALPGASTNGAENGGTPSEPPDPAAPTPAPAPQAPTKPAFDLSEWLVAGSVTAAAVAGQLAVTLFIVFFGLASGNTFKRKLVKLAGPSLSKKKITVQILDNINASIQRYMFMLLVTNVALGLASWGAFYAVGLDNPGAWAIAAGVLHLIPYVGPLVTAVGTGVAAFLQFESFTMMAVVIGINVVIAAVVGMLVATWMTGRIAKMNAMAVFVALLFGGWLWGVWGMLICVPIVVVVKVVAEHVEDLHPLAELLGE